MASDRLYKLAQEYRRKLAATLGERWHNATAPFMGNYQLSPERMEQVRQMYFKDNPNAPKDAFDEEIVRHYQNQNLKNVALPGLMGIGGGIAGGLAGHGAAQMLTNTLFGRNTRRRPKGFLRKMFEYGVGGLGALAGAGLGAGLGGSNSATRLLGNNMKANFQGTGTGYYGGLANNVMSPAYSIGNSIHDAIMGPPISQDRIKAREQAREQAKQEAKMASSRYIGPRSVTPEAIVARAQLKDRYSKIIDEFLS